MRGLVGHSGFVGTNLKRATHFDALFNSSNATELRGRSFDLVVCAAAPATMWAANSNPDADLAIIRSLLENLSMAKIGRLVLISTIAVLDDAAAGYDESDARFETDKAYGRNRRLLEEEATKLADRVHVLRLPALFGTGIKKNFIFDLLNPVPSFLKPEQFEELVGGMEPTSADAVRDSFVLDSALGMLRFEREAIAGTPQAAVVTEAFEQASFTARNFTNSQSRFQYYGLDQLWGDIERSIANDIDLLHVAVEPLIAGDVSRALTGRVTDNTAPALYAEDMRTRHAAAWGKSGDYLYSADETLAALKRFFDGAGKGD